MRKIRFFIKHLQCLARAKSKFSIHSPFVYQFVTEVMKDKTVYPEYQLVKEVKSQLLRSSAVLEATDFGADAGRRNFKTRFRRIGEIARHVGIPDSIGQLLYRMVRYYKPQYILEFGTSLGIGTMFMALANEKAKLITIEGCANTAEIAQKNFDQQKLTNIEMQVGEFSNILDKALKKIPQLDFVFIDGNHRKEPTIHYFKACLAKAHNDTIMVFDDLYWSKGMEQAWKLIKSHPQVTVSIDFCRLGILFFRKELSKEEFVIK